MTSTDEHPVPLPNATPVHVQSEHFTEECDGVIADADYDDGWFYRIEVTAGDRIDGQRNEKGELWVCDFEVVPLEAKEA